jgi:hypothetical protein
MCGGFLLTMMATKSPTWMKSHHKILFSMHFLKIRLQTEQANGSLRDKICRVQMVHVVPKRSWIIHSKVPKPTSKCEPAGASSS